MTRFCLKRCSEAFWKVKLLVERQEPILQRANQKWAGEGVAKTCLRSQLGNCSVVPSLQLAPVFPFSVLSSVFSLKDMRVNEEKACEVGSISLRFSQFLLFF